MAKQAKWNVLSHENKLNVLRDTPVDQIVKDYEAEGLDESGFRQQLSNDIALWQPKLYGGKSIEIDALPNKEVVLGAWRDLDRSEAILEFIDNSIDAWMRRKERYPNKAAPELNIYIDIDYDTGQLTYEDNAGGVQTDRLVNLVIPGHSDTEAIAHSIGSYKTGGKKAIFRLATAVNITTRYWNPAETGDEAVAVHLDQHWLRDPLEYKFPYFPIRDRTAIERGQTRYVMQLRPEPIGNPWFRHPAEQKKIEREIQNTYSLLMARNGAISIFFPKRGTKIDAQLENLYDFSGTHNNKVDIRPQLVRFQMSLDYQGKSHPVAVEVLIGCRVTSAIHEDKGPGFDLFGNNRLFVSRDQRLFADLLPRGSIAGYIRGFVNILAPNVFIPWDTHKRHLNYDREVIEILRNHPVIKNLFENWKEAFSEISDLGKGEVSKTVSTPLPSIVDKKSHDISIPNSIVVDIDPQRRRGQKLPDQTFKPKVGVSKTKRNSGIQVSMVLTTEEARLLAARFAVQGPMDSPKTKRALSEKAKEHLVGLVRKTPRG